MPAPAVASKWSPPSLPAQERRHVSGAGLVRPKVPPTHTRAGGRVATHPRGPERAHSRPPARARLLRRSSRSCRNWPNSTPPTLSAKPSTAATSPRCAHSALIWRKTSVARCRRFTALPARSTSAGAQGTPRPRSGAAVTTYRLKAALPALAGQIECPHASRDRDELRAVVCSTSLELGIDIGTIRCRPAPG